HARYAHQSGHGSQRCTGLIGARDWGRRRFVVGQIFDFECPMAKHALDVPNMGASLLDIEQDVCWYVIRVKTGLLLDQERKHAAVCRQELKLSSDLFRIWQGSTRLRCSILRFYCIL